jgi:hypothetical protein
VNGSDGAPPGGHLVFAVRVVEPEGPRVLERVRGGAGGRGGVGGDLALLSVVVLGSVRRTAAGARGGRPRVNLVGHGSGGGWGWVRRVVSKEVWPFGAWGSLSGFSFFSSFLTAGSLRVCGLFLS